MYKVQSPKKMEKIIYKAKSDGVADVWLRNNQHEIVPEVEDGPAGYEADEIFCQVDAAVISEKEIAADFDFWFSVLEQIPDFDANELGIEARRAAKLSEVSAACEETITAGIDVKIGEEVQHFSLTVHDQINLFGKQAQINAGAEKCEYHNDGNPCKFYTAEEMSQVVTAAMSHVSMQTTYCNSMYDWVKACSKASEIEAIQYGVDIPEEYQSEVLKEYLKEATTK